MDDISFDVLRDQLAEDVRRSIDDALTLGVEFASGSEPESIFRGAVVSSTKQIESHPKGELCQRLLRDDPFGVTSANASGVRGPALADGEIVAAVFFVRDFIVKAFQGCVAELLAVGPLARLFRELQRSGKIPEGCRLIAGDAAMTVAARGNQRLKSADMHAIASTENRVAILGVAEVKSYSETQAELMNQIGRQLHRAKRGLWLQDSFISGSDLTIDDQGRDIVKIGVVPAGWKLPAGFEIKTQDERICFIPDSARAAPEPARVIQLDRDNYRMTLAWSKDALTEAGVAMTWRFMEQVGETIYRNGVPQEWAEMSAAEAGNNAIRMVLHQAVFHLEELWTKSSRDQKNAKRLRLAADAATVLYNSYCFGYAIALAHGHHNGRPRMLWPQDLEEIAASPADNGRQA